MFNLTVSLQICDNFTTKTKDEKLHQDVGPSREAAFPGWIDTLTLLTVTR